MENNNENINADETSSSLNNNIEANGIFAKPIQEVDYVTPVASENASNQVWTGLPEVNRTVQPVQEQIVQPQVVETPPVQVVEPQVVETPVYEAPSVEYAQRVPEEQVQNVMPAPEPPVMEEAKKGGGKALFIIIPIILALFGGGIAFFALSSSSGSSKVMKDAEVDGSSCFEKHCDIYVGMELYEVAKKENAILQNEALYYKDKLTFDLYLTPDNKVSDYKVYVKATKEDVSDVNDENVLRKKLGLFPFGENVEKLTFAQDGYDGVSIENNVKSTFRSYIFTDNDKNVHVFYYYFKGKNNLNSKLKVGKTYTLTFDVVEDDMGDGYKNLLKSIK